jgi:hypothetical protein
MVTTGGEVDAGVETPAPAGGCEIGGEAARAGPLAWVIALLFVALGTRTRRSRPRTNSA